MKKRIVKSPKRSRRWCYTWNNPHLDGDDFLELLKSFSHVRYIIFQRESAPTTGTDHYQGYFEFKCVKSLNTLTSYFQMNYLIARGTAVQNIVYCSKSDSAIDDVVYEWGTYVVQGQRNDIIEFRDYTRSHNARDCLMDYPVMMARFPRFYNLCSELLFEHRELPNKRVILCFGETGTGKTTWARTTYKDYWISPLDSKHWFDGYDRHKVAIFDDYGCDGVVYSMRMLLRLTHKWTESVPIKGSFRPFDAETIVFTSNYPPEDWYDYSANSDKGYLDRTPSFNALKGRFTHIYIFSSDYSHIEVPVDDFFANPKEIYYNKRQRLFSTRNVYYDNMMQ